MGIVINEFEVLAAPRPQNTREASSGAAPGAEGEGAAKPDPADLRCVMRELDRRALRVFAD
jgi:hypothetical protein